MSNKHNFGASSAFDTGGEIRGIYIGTVKSIGGDLSGVNITKDSQRKSDQRFQSDNNIIRCEIKGKNFDDNVPASELPNCLPMLPRHLNVVPKIGEAVLLFIMKGSLEQEERLYMGPIISQPYDLNFEKKEGSALAGYGFGTKEPRENIKNLPDADGVYPNTHDISFQGRKNADLIFKDDEVLLRAGKFVQGSPKKYNQKNPTYIQIKHNFSLEDKEKESSELIGVTNIVSSKINILTHTGEKFGLEDFTLADRKSMISDELLNGIIEKAEPLVFGNKLLEYLELGRAAMVAHVHPQGEPWTVRADGNATEAIDDFLKFDLTSLLSKNIKIN